MSVIVLALGVFLSFVIGVLYELKNNVCADKVSPSVSQSLCIIGNKNISPIFTKFDVGLLQKVFSRTCICDQEKHMTVNLRV